MDLENVVHVGTSAGGATGCLSIVTSARFSKVGSYIVVKVEGRNGHVTG